MVLAVSAARGPHEHIHVLDSSISEPREIRCWWIRIFLQRLFVLLDGLQRGSRGPTKKPSNIEIFMRVHFYVEGFWVPGHGPLAERRPTWRCGPIPVG